MSKPNKAQLEFASGKFDTQKPVARTCAFELEANRLGLSPEQYEASPELKAWCYEMRHSKYVPSVLLSVWKMTTQWDVERKPIKLIEDFISLEDMTEADHAIASYEMDKE